jgi:hypothetical protein
MELKMKMKHEEDEKMIFQKGLRGKPLHNQEPYFGAMALLICLDSPGKKENRDMGVLEPLCRSLSGISELWVSDRVCARSDKIDCSVRSYNWVSTS